MNDSLEIVYKSAQRNLLNRLFTEMLAEKNQKVIVIDDVNNIDLVEQVFSKMDDYALFVTNDNYINERCDYSIYSNRGKVLLTVSEDGCVINNHSQQEYLDDTLCSKLTNLFEVFRHNCENVYTITAA